MTENIVDETKDIDPERAQRFLDTPETSPTILRRGNKSAAAKAEREAQEAAAKDEK